MKTIDLTREKPTLGELLALAKQDTLLIHSVSGEDYLLEPADEFHNEVAALGQSEAFMSFLKERSKEHGDVALDGVKRKRGI
jgi:hypothetical protein